MPSEPELEVALEFDDETSAGLALVQAVAGFRAVLTAAGCVGLPSLIDSLG